jgi:hypothetical protein
MRRRGRVVVALTIALVLAAVVMGVLIDLLWS